MTEKSTHFGRAGETPLTASIPAAESSSTAEARPLPGARYLDAVKALHFPESGDVPEGELHLELRTGLYLLLKAALSPAASVGSDQFVYYDASDPRRCVAPDAYVRLTPKVGRVTSWKVWQRGAPDVAVEIISDIDAGEGAWQRKLADYQGVGVKELLRFDPAAADDVLRIWDRVEGTLCEREVLRGRGASSVLALDWVVAPLDDLPVALRIAARGGPLIPTLEEAAAARIAELEAALALARATR